MGELRKITALIPEDLLGRAQRASGQGLTETLKLGLEAYLHRQWCAAMLAHKDALDLDLDLPALRDDRDFASS